MTVSGNFFEKSFFPRNTRGRSASRQQYFHRHSVPLASNTIKLYTRYNKRGFGAYLPGAYRTRRSEWRFTKVAGQDRRARLVIILPDCLLAEQWLPSALAQAPRVLRRFVAHLLNNMREIPLISPCVVLRSPNCGNTCPIRRYDAKFPFCLGQDPPGCLGRGEHPP